MQRLAGSLHSRRPASTAQQLQLAQQVLCAAGALLGWARGCGCEVALLPEAGQELHVPALCLTKTLEYSRTCRLRPGAAGLLHSQQQRVGCVP